MKKKVTLLSRDAMKKALTKWNQAWNRHDLDGVMQLFHEKIRFENWTGGQVQGKENLREAWRPWFEKHGGFKFSEEETLIDETAQKAVYRWRLDWPSFEKAFEGKPETRHGVDVLHFKEGRIIRKLTYSKTTIEIDAKKVLLTAKEQDS